MPESRFGEISTMGLETQFIVPKREPPPLVLGPETETLGQRFHAQAAGPFLRNRPDRGIGALAVSLSYNDFPAWMFLNRAAILRKTKSHLRLPRPAFRCVSCLSP